MLFTYEAIDQQGKPLKGTVNAASEDVAVVSLQRRGLTVTSLHSGAGGGFAGILSGRLRLFDTASIHDVVLLSREISTLFEAQVSALRVFQLLAEQAPKPFIREALIQVSDDLQSGNSLAQALGKHPKIFSEFYVNMVRSGEESGKLSQTFMYLADFLDRSYELVSKARNALIYPAFVLMTFIVVMVLMLTIVIPKISSVITEAGQAVPVYTQIVISMSNFLVDYGIFLLVFLIVGGFFLYRWARTTGGSLALDHAKLGIPFIGDLYRKLYMSRIADNMHTMLSSGITAVRALKITASVIDNRVYRNVLSEAVESVKGGSSISAALARYPREMPAILVQMMQIGEETGELGNILERLAKFYQREVNASVDTLVNLIEPTLIILLAVGVGFLLASVLVPIYNLSSSI